MSPMHISFHLPPFFYSVIAKINCEHRSVACYGNCDCMIELPRPTAFAAETRQEGSVRGEFLNPMVVEVGCEYIPYLIGCHAGHSREPAVEWAEDIHGEWTAPLAKESSIGTELLYPVIVAVGDVKRSLWIKCHIRRIVELARPDADLARRSPLAHKTAIRLELLNALVVEIRDQQVAVGRDRHTSGRVKLAGATARFADETFGLAIKTEDLNPVIEVFGHVKLAIVNGEIHGAAELARPLAGCTELAFEMAVEVENLDATIAGVGDEHLVAGDSDPGRIVELPGRVTFAAPCGH